MNIRQFNAGYLPNDDRIIFRLNTTDHKEYIFWFTRRITHYILMSTGQFIENEYKKLTPSVEKVISEMNQPEKQETVFNKAWEPGVQYPMGGDAVLVMDARCTLLKTENQDVFSLDFIFPGGGSLNLKLTVPVMKSLLLLLDELNIQAKWGNPPG